MKWIQGRACRSRLALAAAIAAACGRAEANQIVANPGLILVVNNQFFLQGELSTSGEFIGDDGVGLFNQSGGTNIIASNGPLELGCNSGDTGTYVMSSGSLSIGGTEYVGLDGSGVFNQTGSSNVNASGSVYVGDSSNSIGTYNLSGGSFSAPSVSIGGSGDLTISRSAQFFVSGPLDLSPGARVTLNGGNNVVENLAISSGGQVNANAPLFTDYGNAADPVSQIDSYLTDGYSNGWASGPIMSSSVASLNHSSGLKYAIGYADGADGIVPGLSSGRIEIIPTLAGDATLTGTVDFYDFQAVLSDFGKPNQRWDQGDFDYSGTVDFYDFQVVLSNFGQNGGDLSAGELATLNSFAEQYGRQVVLTRDGLSWASVPEPVSAMISFFSLAILARRRRKINWISLR